MGARISKNNAELHPYDKSFDDISNQDSTDHLSSSLKDIMCSIDEANCKAVTSIIQTLNSKKAILENKHLFDLIQEYLLNSTRMSFVCNELENAIERARKRQLSLCVAIKHFKKEEERGNRAQDMDKYMTAMEELKIFRNTENPLAVLPQILKDVRDQHQSLLDKLKHHEKKIKSKLAYLTGWRTVSGAILATVTVTLYICQVVLTVANANENASGVANVLGCLPTQSIALVKQSESQYGKYHSELKREIMLTRSMKRHALVILMNLDEIWVQIDQLEKQLESLKQTIDFELRGKETLKIGFEEIERSAEKFIKTLEELAQYVNICSDHLKKGRSAIQARINEH